MTEGVKTLAYLGVALVVGGIAYFTRPSDVEFRTADDIRKLQGTPLFPEFQDPTEASGLEVVSVDQTLGQVERFEVTRDAKGLWTIPSHNGYPADAENQMRDVSVLFIDLPILGIASTVSEDHALFGVVEPSEGGAESSEGVGRLVRITDKQDDKLVELIIGKPVKDQEGHYFVRKPGQDVVYDVEIDPSKLSTKFEDWIEEDLLKLNAFDVSQVNIKDYSVIGSIERGPSGQRFLRPQQNKRFEAALAWNTEKGQWNLERFTSFNDGNPVEESLPEGEQLNTTRLNELKDSLDDLKIIDVRRKPAGLGEDLRADGDAVNEEDIEALQSLVDMGFYPIPPAAGEPFELRAANGEVTIGMKDGVEYVLRFGNTAGAEKDAADKLNRYLFVTARFNESKIPMPAKPAASAPADNAENGEAATPADSEDAAPEASPADDVPVAPADPGAAEETPADEAPAEETPTEGATDDEAPAGEDSSAVEQATPATFVALQDPAADESQPPAETDAAEEADAAEASAEPAASEPAASEPAAEPAEAAEGAAGSEQPAAAAPAAGDEEAAAERERLAKEYQRQLDEREKKIKDGKKRVDELNDRFADWYYIISEGVYTKIHLAQEDLFQPVKGEGAGVEDFRDLEQGGLEGGAPAAPGLPGLPAAPQNP